MDAVFQAFDHVLARPNGMPKCIVLDTIKGKGVSYMENVAAWHGMAPDAAQYAQAMQEIEASMR